MSLLDVAFQGLSSLVGLALGEEAGKSVGNLIEKSVRSRFLDTSRDVEQAFRGASVSACAAIAVGIEPTQSLISRFVLNGKISRELSDRVRDQYWLPFLDETQAVTSRNTSELCAAIMADLDKLGRSMKPRNSVEKLPEEHWAQHLGDSGAFSEAILHLVSTSLQVRQETLSFLRREGLFGSAVLYFFRERLKGDPRLKAAVDEIQQSGALSHMREHSVGLWHLRTDLSRFEDTFSVLLPQISEKLGNIEGLLSTVHEGVESVRLAVHRNSEEVKAHISSEVESLPEKVAAIVVARIGLSNKPSAWSEPAGQVGVQLGIKEEALSDALRMMGQGAAKCGLSSKEVGTVATAAMAVGRLREAEAAFHVLLSNQRLPTEEAAEAHFKLFLTRLRLHELGEALESLLNASNLMPERYQVIDRRRYRVNAILGSGVLGCALQCLDLQDGSSVAVKALWPEAYPTARDETSRYQRAREIRSDHLVPVLDVRLSPEAPGVYSYVVYPFLDGVLDAEAWVNAQEHGLLSPLEAIRVGRQLARGLQDAHEADVLNLSLKPGNVLLREEGGVVRARIGDWCVHSALPRIRRLAEASRAFGQRSTGLTSFAQHLVSELDYSAEEVLAANPRFEPERRSDLFSLGSVLAFLLNGRSPRTLPPSATEGYERFRKVIDLCRSQEVGRRPGSAKEVALELGEILRDLGEVAISSTGSDSRDSRSRASAQSAQAQTTPQRDGSGFLPVSVQRSQVGATSGNLLWRPLEPGTRVGNFEVVARIGAGGMGEVFRVRNVVVGVEMAIKVLSSDLSHNSEAVGRFHREAQAASQTGHSAVVRPTDFGSLDDGRAYYVMPLLRGMSFGDYLERRDTVEVGECSYIMTPVMEALQRAHEAGIIHRDIKPDNIFLDTGDNNMMAIRLLDFGIAKLSTRDSENPNLTRTSDVLGTPQFMPSEQMAGPKDSVGPWSDVYAVGAVLYRAFGGRAPFAGSNPIEIYNSQREGRLVPLRSLRPDLPLGLEPVVLAALAFDHRRRYQSISHLQTDLQRCVPGWAEGERAPQPAPRPEAIRRRETSYGQLATSAAASPGPTAIPGPARSTHDPLPTARPFLAQDPASAWPRPSPPQGSGQTSLSGAAAQVSLPPGTFNDTPRRRTGLFYGVIGAVAVLCGVVVAVVVLSGKRTSPSREPAPAKEKSAALIVPTREASAPPVARRLVAETRVPGIRGGPMVLLDAGCFEMGRVGFDPDEVPVHRVCLDGYLLDRTEVTVSDYAKCVEAGACGSPKSFGAEEAWKKQCNWGAPGREQHPVNCVTWDQAKGFCLWAGKRLPTEAEWEYAARSGGKGRMYPWGEEAPSCDRVVMGNGEAQGCGRDSTWPVGSKPLGATPEGLLDLAGNVWEWTADCWYLKSYSSCAVECRNPSHPCDDARTKRVIRGSSFQYGPDKMTSFRTSLRGYYKPKAVAQGVGFRCAKAAPQKVARPTEGTAASTGELKISRVEGSSHLTPFRGHTFQPGNAVDGNLETAWQPRGSKEDSKGQWIKLHLYRKATVTGLRIANGYQRKDGDMDLFLLNSRLNEVTVHFSNGLSQSISLPGDKRGLVEVTLKPMKTSWVQLSIESIHAGEKWNDVGLSEVKVLGE